ncbi:MAG TPA: LysM peptidoglycan-binding domain-containing protein [Kofleriaceae bacterium]|nr:LysM peptidoglycan-binding domain-containing protein [Kofleriaceae bacterium]
MTRRSLAALLLCTLVASAHAQTATQTIRVKPKDSLDLIAAEYYGDRQSAVFIIAENKLKDRRLPPYARLRIPVTRDIVTDRGDTFQTLAEKYLGDKARAQVLAEYNELDISETPAIGTPLTIPFQVTHAAQGTESLASIASTYLGDAKQAEFIRKYNGLDKTSIEKGESVLVPVLVRMRPGKGISVDADAKARNDQHRKAMASIEDVLPNAHAAWLMGDFKSVKDLLVPFADKTELLDMKVAVDLNVLLGKAHMAFNETQPAIDAFKRVLARKSWHRLSSFYESPKVLDAWKQAGGQLSE